MRYAYALIISLFVILLAGKSFVYGLEQGKQEGGASAAQIGLELLTTQRTRYEAELTKQYEVFELVYKQQIFVAEVAIGEAAILGEAKGRVLSERTEWALGVKTGRYRTEATLTSMCTRKKLFIIHGLRYSCVRISEKF